MEDEDEKFEMLSHRFGIGKFELNENQHKECVCCRRDCSG